MAKRPRGTFSRSDGTPLSLHGSHLRQALAYQLRDERIITRWSSA